MILEILLASFLVHGSDSGEKVKQKATETVEATKEYAADKKSKFLSRMDKELKKIDKSLDDLATKVRASGKVASEETKKGVDKLSQRRDEIKEDLKKAGDTTSSAFQDIKDGIKKAVAELNKSIKAAREKFDTK